MRAPPALPPGCDPDSIVLTFSVAREQAGQRLDRFLNVSIPRISRTKANAIVRRCAYHPDGRRRMPSDRVKYGETVVIVRPPMKEPDAPTEFTVVHEDAALLVVSKPAGLPMHPSATYHKRTLTYVLWQHYGEPAPQPCHRLDRETSGIVVCAKDGTSERITKQAFEARGIRKVYTAIVRGEMREDRGVIDSPLGPSPDGLHIMMAVRHDDEGLDALTEWEVIARRSGMTMVRLHPRTGRQHQLRVHLASIGHPIIGCKLYGPEGQDAFVEYIDSGMSDDLLARLGHPRHALHASELSMEHPITRELCTFVAPLPPDLQRLWDNGTS